MKCYTTYFAKVKSLPEGIVPISICGKAPDAWTGLQYRKLAPGWWFLSKWKENHDNAFYIENFDKEVLGPKDPNETWDALSALSGGRPFALVCYEKPGDFCHRHLVAEWFRKAGYEIDEWNNDKKEDKKE